MTNHHDLQPLVALVVDDRESSRYLSSSWLTRAGFTVITAETGTEALAILHTEHIDLAVLDVHLADMTGFDVCEAIRADPRTQAMPVIHVSATAVGPADRSEGLLRGADAYLVEPVEPREFMAIVTALIRRAEFRRRVMETSVRLRSLNSATADVHGASSDLRVFHALVDGASRIADRDAIVITRSAEHATRWRRIGDTIEAEPIERSVVDAVLEPAQVGHHTLTTEDPFLVTVPHAGAAFVDEAGEPAGLILVPAHEPELEAEVLPLLAQLGITASLALANLRALDVEHRIALVLQQSLLPQSAPVVDGLAVAFRYAAASQHAQVGGDFYEAFALDDHQVVIAIGDVVGHSLRAATVMGEIRHALRAYALDGYPPNEIVRRLDHLVRHFHPDMYTSLVCGMIDTRTAEFTFCGAGHLPIYWGSGADAQPLHTGGSLLGTGTGYELCTVALGPGDRIVMVTDGLIERRHEPIDLSLEELRVAIAELATTRLDQMVDHLLTEVGPAVPADDIAIIAFELS
ncbi:MAG TPA: SpoIIE family protein phosphatase [Ilumatobacteraceae bacterium]